MNEWSTTYYLDVAATEHHSVHLLQRQVRSLGNVVLDEGEALVLVGDGVPTQIHALDRSERDERLLDRVLTDLEVDAANVDPARKNTKYTNTSKSRIRPLLLENLPYLHMRANACWRCTVVWKFCIC